MLRTSRGARFVVIVKVALSSTGQALRHEPVASIDGEWAIDRNTHRVAREFFGVDRGVGEEGESFDDCGVTGLREKRNEAWGARLAARRLTNAPSCRNVDGCFRSVLVLKPTIGLIGTAKKSLRSGGDPGFS